MGSLYRSEIVSLYQLFLQSSSAYSCLSALGELGLVQFRDLNAGVNIFQRKFVTEFRRCEEMERKLKFLEKEINNIEGLKMAKLQENPPAPLPPQTNELEANLEQLQKDITEINANLEQLEKDIKEINVQSDHLRTNLQDLTELNYILSKSQALFQENNQGEIQAALSTDPTAAHEQGRLGFLAGVLAQDRVSGFERILWRACRGNALLRLEEIEQITPPTGKGEEVRKSAFVIFYQGDHLKEKVKKICDGYRATLYNCPESAAERLEMGSGVQARIQDLENVLKQTTDHKNIILTTVAKEIKCWFSKVLKVKGIYYTMNFLNIDLTQKCLVGECWIPAIHLQQVQAALKKASEDSGSGPAGAILTPIETKKSPPTYNKTNKFTKVFQGIVNSYGVATYREVNPAPFTIISFPFLFSMMFGDIGHGLLVFLAGLVIILFEKRLMKNKSNNEIWNIFFGGRYIIMLMGAFSVYAGLLYNDMFSISINIFGSEWYPSPERYNQTTVLEHNKDMTLDPNTTDYLGQPYPFGMDPVWQLTLNKISFLNSFKMKLSIIFGVTQMTFGVVLSLQNHRYFRDPINIFCEFIPEMLFLMSIFGYLIVLIIYKWIMWDASRANCAPSLLIDLINMFLFNYPSEPCGSVLFYTGQKTLQTVLLLIVVACIPWLLIPKPLLLRRKHNQEMKKMAENPEQNEKDVDIFVVTVDDEYADVDALSDNKKRPLQPAPALGLDEDEEEKFNFGDIFVHQCIHTIEFCLGCISHTASYLRLWALSLAHAELSEVLWHMVLHNGFVLLSGYGAVVTIFVIFAPWAVLTVCILLLMEGLSAFLHTLRLHWVEFQSKFYKGEGYVFQPFDFGKLQLKTAGED